jgi:L-seryl-tRNA(Ser) seleniumtransferase
MQTSKAEVARRAEAMVAKMESAREGATQLRAELMDGESLLGGGSAPSSTLPTTVIALTSNSFSPNELAARLRAADPPVIARVEDGRVLLDLRTVFPEQDDVLTQILVSAPKV